MTRFSVCLHPEAEAEFEQAFLWYFERSPMAARAFRDEVTNAIDALELDAHTWPCDEDGVQYHVLTRFPYTIRYELEGATVTVLAIAHHKRHPKYWSRRT